MKEIELTQGKVALVDDEDFDYINQWKWFAHKERNTFCAMRHEGRTLVLMHREIMKTPDDLEVDHKDMNELNNQKCNMRNCTHTQNNQNKKPQLNNPTGYKGIVHRKTTNHYQSYIKANGEHFYLGTFLTAEEAALAYDKAAVKYFGDFAWLNFPELLETTRTLNRTETNSQDLA